MMAYDGGIWNVNNCDKEEAMKFVQLIAAKNDTKIKSTRNKKHLKVLLAKGLIGRKI